MTNPIVHAVDAGAQLTGLAGAGLVTFSAVAWSTAERGVIDTITVRAVTGVVPTVGAVLFVSPAEGTLDYDGQTGNFTEGLVLTGGTSGATAVIEDDVDAGATGTLLLTGIVGVYIDNETLTDSAAGAAVANGVLTGITHTVDPGAVSSNFSINGPIEIPQTVQGLPWRLRMTTANATGGLVLHVGWHVERRQAN